jgi:hypothetical protein
LTPLRKVYLQLVALDVTSNLNMYPLQHADITTMCHEPDDLVQKHTITSGAKHASAQERILSFPFSHTHQPHRISTTQCLVTMSKPKITLYVDIVSPFAYFGFYALQVSVVSFKLRMSSFLGPLLNECFTAVLLGYFIDVEFIASNFS